MIENKSLIDIPNLSTALLKKKKKKKKKKDFFILALCRLFMAHTNLAMLYSLGTIS